MERQIELMRLANKSVFTIARELNIGEDEVLAVIAGLKMPLPRSNIIIYSALYHIQPSTINKSESIAIKLKAVTLQEAYIGMGDSI